MVEALKQKSIATLDHNSMQELEVIFMEYSQGKDFPDGHCNMISRDIAKSLEFEYCEGYFRFDFPNEKGKLLTIYAWCKDAQKTIIDLTAHQFNAYLKNPLFRSVQVVHPEDPLYKRYSPLNSQRTTL